MDVCLAGLPGVATYLDDILITGSTEDQHLERLEAVLRRLSQAGLKVKKEKCHFDVSDVEFLGYRVNAAGIRPTQEKVKAIVEAPEPKNKAELQSFLGMITFYNRFLRHRATVAESLHRLLDKNTTWKWESRHSKDYQMLKNLLLSADILAHYDPDKPLYLSCDASPYGVGPYLPK